MWYLLFVDIDISKHIILWKDRKHVSWCKLGYDGVPYMILASKVYTCEYGKDTNRRRKERRQQQIMVRIFNMIIHLGHLALTTLWSSLPSHKHKLPPVFNQHILIGQKVAVNKKMYRILQWASYVVWAIESSPSLQCDNRNIKRRPNACKTKKQNCPARIVVKEVLKFPEYKVSLHLLLHTFYPRIPVRLLHFQSETFVTNIMFLKTGVLAVL